MLVLGNSHTTMETWKRKDRSHQGNLSWQDETAKQWDLTTNQSLGQWCPLLNSTQLFNTTKWSIPALYIENMFNQQLSVWFEKF